MRHLGRTTPFRGPDGHLVPNSIAEVHYLRLGGVDQWVMIRGESLTNPPLVFLHGGPGLSETRLFRSFNAPLEKDFTVDLPNLLRGFRFSLDAMWAEVTQLNLAELAPTLQVPVFFFLGRRDHWVPPDTSVAYFDTLSAPSKELVWFEESGHEPFVDEPARFNTAMLERVRPVVAEHGRGPPPRA